MSRERGSRPPGMIYVLWGSGKGKTTSAIGMALRALGHGWRVHVLQFMKRGPLTQAGEIDALASLERVSVERFGADEWVVGEITPAEGAAIEEAVGAASEAVSSGRFDLVVLDEILYAVCFGVLSEEQVVGLLQRRAAATDVVLTGGWTQCAKIVQMADLVTEMKKVKHPFDLGAHPREGIEF